MILPGGEIMYYKLKNLRYKNKLTSKEMALKLGISTPFYCQLENGNRRMSYDMAIRIAEIFGKRPDTIFYNDFMVQYEKENKVNND